MSAEDEARAAAYRTSMAARAAFRLALARSMTGDPDAAAAVRDAWEPVLVGQDVPLVGEE